MEHANKQEMIAYMVSALRTACDNCPLFNMCDKTDAICGGCPFYLAFEKHVENQNWDFLNNK